MVKLNYADSEGYAYGIYMTSSNNRFSNNIISETVSIYGGEGVYAYGMLVDSVSNGVVAYNNISNSEDYDLYIVNSNILYL